MSNTNESVDNLSNEFKPLFPLTFTDLKIWSDIFKQIELRVKKSFPGISDDSLKEVARRYVRTKLKGDIASLPKAIIHVNENVPENAPLNSSTQQPKVNIKPVEVNYDDFRLLTNIESYIVNSKNFAPFSLEEKEAAIKKYYHEVFITSDEWPKEIYFRKDSIPAEKHLENLDKSNITREKIKRDASNIVPIPLNPKIEVHRDMINAPVQNTQLTNTEPYNYTNNESKSNEIEILPCQISYEDFRTLTNIEFCIVSDILQKFPGKSKRYLQQIDKYIRRHYETDFVKKSKWPEKVRFYDPNIRTLEDLIALKIKKCNKSFRVKKNGTDHKVPIDINAAAAENGINIGDKASNNISPELFSLSGKRNEMASQADAKAAVDSIQKAEKTPNTKKPNKKETNYSHHSVKSSVGSKNLIAKQEIFVKQSPSKSFQDLTFFDTANFEERQSQSDGMISCSANDPLTLNSSDLERMNVSGTSSIDHTEDIHFLDKSVNNGKTFKNQTTISKSPKKKRHAERIANKRFLRSRSSVDTDIFPPSLELRNQSNRVAKKDKRMLRCSKNHQSPSPSSNEVSFANAPANSCVMREETEKGGHFQPPCEKINAKEQVIFCSNTKTHNPVEDGHNSRLEPEILEQFKGNDLEKNNPSTVVLNPIIKQESKERNTAHALNLATELTTCPTLNTIIHALPAINGESNPLLCSQSNERIKQENNETCVSKNVSDCADDVQIIETEASEPLVINESGESSKNLLAKMMDLSVSPKTPRSAFQNNPVIPPLVEEIDLPLGSLRAEFQSGKIGHTALGKNVNNMQLRKRKKLNSSTTLNESSTKTKSASSKVDNDGAHILAAETSSVKISNAKACRLRNNLKTPQPKLNKSKELTDKQSTRISRKRTSQFDDGVSYIKRRKVQLVESTESNNGQVSWKEKINKKDRYQKKTQSASIEVSASIFHSASSARANSKKRKSRKGLKDSQESLHARNNVMADKLLIKFGRNVSNSTQNISRETVNTHSILLRTLTQPSYCWMTHLTLRPILNTAVDHIYCRYISPILTNQEDPSLQLTIHLWRHKLLIVSVFGRSMKFQLGVNAADEEATFNFLEMLNANTYSSSELVTIIALQNILEKFVSISITEKSIITNSDCGFISGEFFIREDPIAGTHTQINRCTVLSPTGIVDKSISKSQCNGNGRQPQLEQLPTKSTSANQQSLNSSSANQCLAIERDANQARNENPLENAPFSTDDSSIIPQDIKIEQDGEIVTNDELNFLRNLSMKVKTEEIEESELAPTVKLDMQQINCQLAHLNEPTRRNDEAQIDDYIHTSIQIAPEDNEPIYPIAKTEVNVSSKTGDAIAHLREKNADRTAGCRLKERPSNVQSSGQLNRPNDITNDVRDNSHQALSNSEKPKVFKGNNGKKSVAKHPNDPLDINTNATQQRIIRSNIKSMVENNVMDIDGRIIDFTLTPVVILEKISKMNKVTKLSSTNLQNKSKNDCLNTLKADAEELTSKRMSCKSIQMKIKANSDIFVRARMQLKDISENTTNKRKCLEPPQECKPKKRCKVDTKTKNKKKRKVTNNVDEAIVPQAVHNFRPLTLVSESKSGKRKVPKLQILDDAPVPTKNRRKQHNKRVDPDYFIEDTSQIEPNLPDCNHVSQALLGDELDFGRISTDSRCLDMLPSESTNSNDTHPQDVTELESKIFLIQPVREQQYVWMTHLVLARGLNTAYTCIFYDSTLPVLNFTRCTPVQSKILLRRHQGMSCEIFGDNFVFRFELDAINEQVLFALLSWFAAPNNSIPSCSTLQLVMIRIFMQFLQNFQKFSSLSICEEVQHSDFVLSSCIYAKSNNDGIILVPSTFFDKILKVFELYRCFNSTQIVNEGS